MIVVFKEKNSTYNDVHVVTVVDAGSLYNNQFLYFKPREGFASDCDDICDSKTIESIHRSTHIWLANGLITKDEQERYVYEVEIIYMSPELELAFVYL